MYILDLLKKCSAIDKENVLEWIFGDLDIEDKIDSLKKEVEDDKNINKCFGLGLLYFYGIGLDKDYKESLEYFNKVYSNLKDSTIQYLIGLLYLEGGYGIEQDITKAITFFSESSDNGNVEALYKLGCIYKDGIGVDKNYEEATKYFEKATAKGHLKSHYELGLLYYFGLGVPLNKEKAKLLFYDSNEQGDISSKIILKCLFNNK